MSTGNVVVVGWNDTTASVISVSDSQGAFAPLLQTLI